MARLMYDLMDSGLDERIDGWSNELSDGRMAR